MNERLNVAFLGHVDHGKSTLIGRLLYDTGSVPPDRMELIQHASEAQGLDTEFAFLMDHFREEREHGMTIDTAQVFFHAAERDYVVIDAPGHREFLKNMLTGASQAQAAVLIVDVAQGLGEQTRRHAFLVNFLGIRHVVAVFNKMDLAGFAPERFEAVRGEAEAFLARLGIRPVACIPISARYGDNVVSPSTRTPWYDGPTVIEALDGIQVAGDSALPMRFCVQGVYCFGGPRIVAGRLESGTLAAGDAVLALPDGLATRVETIERFLSERTDAEAGECIGVTLPAEATARRGQVLCSPESPPGLATRLAAHIFWLSDAPLERGATALVRIATQEAPCRIAAIRSRMDSSTLETIESDAARLETTEVGEVELEAATPLVAELARDNPALGRLVLEDNGCVTGAGIISHVKA